MVSADNVPYGTYPSWPATVYNRECHRSPVVPDTNKDPYCPRISTGTQAYWYPSISVTLSPLLLRIKKTNLKGTADEAETNLNLSFGVLRLMRVNQRCKKPAHTKMQMIKRHRI
jgi:hypothetical protein